MLRRETPIHIIDFEGSARSGIVEYGVVTLLGTRIEETHTRLCCPMGEIDAPAFAQHGIREREARKYPPFSDEWDFFNQLRASGPLAAHHASVEHGFLKKVWAYPSAAPDFTDPQKRIANWGPWIDTLKLAQAAFPQLKSYKLTTLTEQLDLGGKLEPLVAQYCPPERSQPHCALYDCLASALVLLEIFEEESWQKATLTQLLHISAASKQAQRNLQQKELF